MSRTEEMHLWVRAMILRSGARHTGEFQKGYTEAMYQVLKNLDTMIKEEKR